MTALRGVLLPPRNSAVALHRLAEQTDRLSRQRLAAPDALDALDALTTILGTARFSPGLPLDLRAPDLPGGPEVALDLHLASDVPNLAAAGDLVLQRLDPLPLGHTLVLQLDLRTAPRFLVSVRRLGGSVTGVVGDEPPAPFRAPVPVGQSGAALHTWFEGITDAQVPVHDGTLDTAQRAARAYALRAKASNTRRAYRSGIKT